MRAAYHTAPDATNCLNRERSSPRLRCTRTVPVLHTASKSRPTTGGQWQVAHHLLIDDLWNTQTDPDVCWTACHACQTACCSRHATPHPPCARPFQSIQLPAAHTLPIHPANPSKHSPHPETGQRHRGTHLAGCFKHVCSRPPCTPAVPHSRGGSDTTHAQP